VARARRQDVTLFNFSFVDILATTIGVLVFIMVLVLLNATGRISAEDVREQARRAQERLKKHQLAAERWDRRAAREQGYRQAYLRAARAAGPAQERLADETARRRELERETRQLGQAKAALELSVATSRRRAAALAAQVSQQASQEREQVPFRIPHERPTTKESVFFECVGGRVYLMAVAGRLYERNYRATSLVDAVLLERKPDAVGETSARARRRGSLFLRELGSARRTTHFGHFIVREDSFALFRRLRGLLWQRGFDYNWQPMQADVIPAASKSRQGRQDRTVQ
jgi:hypothetical protein